MKDFGPPSAPARPLISHPVKSSVSSEGLSNAMNSLSSARGLSGDVCDFATLCCRKPSTRLFGADAVGAAYVATLFLHDGADWTEEQNA